MNRLKLASKHVFSKEMWFQKYSTSMIQCRIDGTADAWRNALQIDIISANAKEKLEDFVG